MITRKKFLRVGSAALAARYAQGAQEAGTFRFAVIADTHIIDGFYPPGGAENGREDNESIFQTSARLTAVREHLNGLRPKLEMVFLAGDYFHNYPSPDVDFYFQNKTRIDHAKELTDGFQMPVHVGFGNHDYSVPKVSREMSHELFRRKLGVKPYYSVEHKGVKFVHLNNFLGDTWAAGHAKFDKGKGSLGEEQLNWFEAELRQQQPTFVFVHFPMSLIVPAERADYGMHSLVKQHRGTIQRVISGHWHRWFEFGRSYGPQHLVMAATRYDPNAYLVVEMNPRRGTHTLLNIERVDWNTHFSEPFRG